MTVQTAGSLLAASHLFFSYGERHVLNDLSVAFEPGLTWLQGANGSGKSTLLKLLGGVLEPSSGSRTVRGIDAKLHPLDYRRHIFWCGPGPVPLGHLRPPEYFGLLQGLYPSFNASSIAGHIEGFGLGPQMQTRIQALSTGTQRKVWLTAALAAGTQAVLVDEPLNALDRPSLAYARLVLRACAMQAEQAWVIASHEAPCEPPEGIRVLRLA